jgi:HEAT repeat protein
MPVRIPLVGLSIVALTLAGSAKDVVEKLPPDAKREEKKVDTPPKPPEPPLDPIKAAEKTLADAKIDTDAKSLLEFFKSRTLSDDDRAKLLTTIRRLGDDDFDVREQASEELTRAGLAALPILRAASKDKDVEVSRRVELCLQKIHQDQETAKILAAARLLAHQKAEGMVETLLAYLPCIPDDEVVIDGIRQAFVAYTKATGKADPLLKKALDDADPARRALAVQVFGEALPSEREVVRSKLEDPNAKVRYLAGSTLAKAGDAKALRSLLKLIAEGPVEYAFQVEDMLCQLLDSEEKPPATLSGDNKNQREKARAEWEKWLDARGDKVKLTRLTEAEPMRGLTLVIEVDGGGTNGGRIWECGPDGKQRWELTNLGGPVDVQVLPGGRLLIPEYYSSRVTERDREGKILWESPRLTGNTVAAQRLPNGNTLIATMQGVVEYTRGNEKVADFPNPGGTVYQAIRHRNGHTFILAGNNITEYDADRKQVRQINVGSLSGWAGFEILPNGNFLIAYYSQNSKYAEIDGNGKTVWEHSTNGAATRLDPTRVQRLRNGNTLVAGGNMMFVVEYDRDKKEVWKVATKGRPFGVRRY